MKTKFNGYNHKTLVSHLTLDPQLLCLLFLTVTIFFSSTSSSLNIFQNILTSYYIALPRANDALCIIISRFFLDRIQCNPDYLQTLCVD